MKCYICNKEYKNWAGLATHIRRTHNYDSIRYYNEFISSKEKYCNYCGKPNCKFRSLRDGYSNFCNKECDNLYRKKYGWSDNVRLKMSNSTKERFKDDAERKKISKSVKKLWDNGTYSKDHISLLSKERTISNEERQIRSDVCRMNFKGIKKSEIHKKKISKSLTGKSQSQETIEKRRQKQIGRKQPDSFISKMSKENNPNWRGGYRKNYGERWRFIREEIIKKFNNKCVICGISRIDHLQKYNRDLSIHHIIKRSKFYKDINLSNFKDNLVSLCSKCHGLVDNCYFFEIDKNEENPYNEFIKRFDLYMENQIVLMESLYDKFNIDYNKILIDELNKMGLNYIKLKE